MGDGEVIIDGSDGDLAARLVHAITKVSDQDQLVWVVTPAGKRIAAIVPVDVAEEHERQIEAVMATAVDGVPLCLQIPHERHTRGDGVECLGWPPDHRPVNQWVPAPGCRLPGHAAHELSGVIHRPGNDGMIRHPRAAEHAHWAGDREAGHEAYMQASTDLMGSGKRTNG